MVDNLKTILANICRFLLGSVFILSGFVKAVDPLGTQYKINDYLLALGIADYVPEWIMLACSLAMSALEFVLGMYVLFALKRKVTAKLTIAFLCVMTAITTWLYVANPVSDCGCFGDAVKLTNGQTLLKNVILLACAAVIYVWSGRMVRFLNNSNHWIVINYAALFILFVEGYSLYRLPVFDFRPYMVGVNIWEAMQIPEGAEQPKFETTYVMRKGGEEKTFTVDNYPDSTWIYVDSKTVMTKKGYEPPIHDFTMQDADGDDVTEQVLTRKGYVFLLVAPSVEKANDANFGDIDFVHEYAKSNGYPFYCLTASGRKGIDHWIDITGAEYPFLISDETALKTVIRSNPGLVLLKDGTIIGKWSDSELPGPDVLTASLDKLPMGYLHADSVSRNVMKIFLWFLLPLILLTMADRTWAWSKWIREKEKSNSLYNFLKRKKTMRKKIVAGNWKMNLNLQEGVALAKELNEKLTADKPNCDVVICTPFIHLASVASVINQDVVALGAENCADKEKGAYTGEVSASMVKSTGAQYVILGHSERRQYYGETAEILKEKVLLALANGLKVIFCIGETLEEREADKQEAVVKAELEGSVFNLSAEEWKNIVLAYEPIWAIGTGKTATAEQAEEMLAYIRSIVAEKYGKDAAEDTTILYGGSCKASNAPELFSKPDIDGGLIGGASLKADDFKGIIDAWKK